MGTSWILAIDFGTTTTSAAMGVDGRAEVVEIDGAARMPSVVLATDSGELVVGAAAEAQVALSPERAERTPKRRLGDEMMLLGPRPVRPVEAVAAILRTIAGEAIRRQGGQPPSELRLTHPARWGSVRREKLAEAAALAELPVPVFVPEPVAAAVHFLDERIDDGAFVAVYDLGGGTFDTAVLRRAGEGFDVVGLPGGDERLGGEAFDERLFTHVGDRLAEQSPEAWESLRFSTDRSWRKVGHDLRLEVRRAKEALSSNAEYTVYVGSPVDATVLITRDELESLIVSDVTATVDELEATVQRAGIAIDDLAAVNLAGGSSRIPLVTRLVAERFGQLPQTWGDPKAAVALGAVKATRLTSLASAGGSASGGLAAPIAAAAAPLPETIGSYEVITELGRGGMGVVYLARQASVGRLVAVKTLPVVDPNLTDRLRREASVLAELQHPHIATVIDVGADERGTHVVMPFLPGGTVAHVLDRSGPLAPGAAAAVLASVAEALAATHGKGFLHRDVKPSNVLLSEGGDTYLADFGLALPMLDSSRLTNSRSVLGTAPYTAPEILADETPSPAADTYALGVTGYQLLTGALPYAGSNVLAVLDAVRRSDATPISEVAPAVPPALAALVTQAFAADPADRPRDLRAWAADVRAAAEPQDVHPAPPAAWAAAVAGAPLAIPASAEILSSDQPTGSDGPRTDDLAAAAAIAAGGAALAGASVAGAEPVPADVADLIGYQAAGGAPPGGGGDTPEDLAAVPPPKGRLGVTGRRALGAAAAVVLLIGAVVLATRGDDPKEIRTAGSQDTTTTSTTEGDAEPAAEKVEVPDVIGKTQGAATMLLVERGFKVSVAEKDSDDQPRGIVLEASPNVHTRQAKGVTVTIVVSKGPPDTGGTGGDTTGGDGGSTTGGDGGSTTGGDSGGDGGSTTGGDSGGTTTGTDDSEPPPPPPNSPPVKAAGVPSTSALTIPASENPTYWAALTQVPWTDPEGDAIKLLSVSGATNGSAYVASCGASSLGCVYFDPTNYNWCGTQTLYVRAYDPNGSGRASAHTQTLTMTVNCN
jgi:hypothetical protein